MGLVARGVESFDGDKRAFRKEIRRETRRPVLARTLEKERVNRATTARHAAQPEAVMILAFPFALLGAAFLAFVTLAARA